MTWLHYTIRQGNLSEQTGLPEHNAFMQIAAFYVFALSMLCMPCANASLYYIDPLNGSDEASGNKESPWKTLQVINKSRIRPGDIVHLHSGAIWRETLSIVGLDGGPEKIVIRSYPNAMATQNPVISCADDITDSLWPGLIVNGGFESSKVGGCINNLAGWNTKLGEDTNCTIQNEGQARNYLEIVTNNHPLILESNNFQLEKNKRYHLGGLIKLGNNSKVDIYLFSYQPGSLYQLRLADSLYIWEKSPNAEKKPFLSMDTHGHRKIDMPIDGINGGSVRLILMINKHSTVMIDDVIFTSENSHEQSTLLSSNGLRPKILIINNERVGQPNASESKDLFWRTSEDNILHLASKDGSYTNAPIQVGHRTKGIHVKNSNNIIIEDIEIQGCEGHNGKSESQGAGILITDGSSENIIRNITIKNSDEGIRIEGNPKNPLFHKNNIIENINIFDNLSKGISVRSYAINTVIRNCTIKNLAVFDSDMTGQDIEGVNLGGEAGEIYDTEISNCILSSIAPQGKGPIAAIAAFNTRNTNIVSNFISYTGKNGIILANSSNSRIAYNTIHHTGLSKSSRVGAGIAVIADTDNMDGIVIENNTISDCHNEERFYGGITLQAKPCRHQLCTEDFYQLSHVININNIVSNCAGKYPFSFFAENIDFDTLTSDHNLYYASNPNDILILYRGNNYRTDQRMNYSEWRSLESHNGDRRNIKRLLEQNSLNNDPGFMDAGNNDYRLRKDSPAYRKGKKPDGTVTNIGSN